MSRRRARAVLVRCGWVRRVRRTGSGAPGLSDSFLNGFFWLNKLGLSARMGLDVVVRQSIYKGFYALLDLKTNPNPVLTSSFLLCWVSRLTLVNAGLLPECSVQADRGSGSTACENVAQSSRLICSSLRSLLTKYVTPFLPSPLSSALTSLITTQGQRLFGMNMLKEEVEIKLAGFRLAKATVREFQLAPENGNLTAG